MRKRKYTEEETAAREARKARVRELAKRVSALTPEQRVEMATRAGIRTIEGRELSAHNACLLMHQLETVSVVGGFHQWKKAGRCVCKGVHGLAIWVPTGNKNESGEIEERTGFIGATVFDISQTRALDEPPPPTEAREPLALTWSQAGVEIVKTIAPAFTLEA